MVQLNGRLNKTGVISPRFNVQVNQIENWVNLLLPARSFGKLILVSALVEMYSLRLELIAFVKTTSSGILDHEEARRKNVGGKILGYIY